MNELIAQLYSKYAPEKYNQETLDYIQNTYTNPEDFVQSFYDKYAPGTLDEEKMNHIRNTYLTPSVSPEAENYVINQNNAPQIQTQPKTIEQALSPIPVDNQQSTDTPMETNIQSDVTSRIEPHVMIEDVMTDENLKLMKESNIAFKNYVKDALKQTSGPDVINYIDGYFSGLGGEGDAVKDLAEDMFNAGESNSLLTLPSLYRREDIITNTLAEAKKEAIKEEYAYLNEIVEENKDNPNYVELEKKKDLMWIKSRITHPDSQRFAIANSNLRRLKEQYDNAIGNGDVEEAARVKKLMDLAIVEVEEAQKNYVKFEDPNFKALFDLNTFERVDSDFVTDEEMVEDITSLYNEKREELQEYKKSDYENFENNFDVFQLRYQDNESRLNSTYNITASTMSAYGQALQSLGYESENGVYNNVKYKHIMTVGGLQNKTNGYLANPEKPGEVGSRDLIIQDKSTLFGENLNNDKEIAKGLEAENMAWTDMYLLNRDPSSIKRTGVFLETLAEESLRVVGKYVLGVDGVDFAKDVSNGLVITNNDRLENIQTAMDRTLRDIKDKEGNVIGEEQFQFTKNQLKNFELTKAQMTAQTIGGIIPMLAEFGLINRFTGGMLNTTGLSRTLMLWNSGKYYRNGKLLNNKYFKGGIPKQGIEKGALDNYLAGRFAKGISKVGGGNLDKAKHLLVMAALEEGKMRFVGMDEGVGAGFAIAGTGFNKLSQRFGLKFSGNLGLVLNAPLKLGKDGLALAVSAEVADPLSAAYKDFIGDKSFQRFMEEHYSDFDKWSFNFLQNFIAGKAFGVARLRKADFYNTIGNNGRMINNLIEKNTEIFERNKGKVIKGKDGRLIDRNNELISELNRDRQAAYNTVKYFDVKLRIKDLNSRFEDINKKRVEQGRAPITVQIQTNSKGMDGRVASFSYKMEGGKPNYNKPFIRINARKLNPGTVPHEVFHLLAQESFKSDPAVFGKLRDIIQKTVDKTIPLKELIKDQYGDQAKESRPVEYFANLVEILQKPEFRDAMMKKNTFGLIAQDIYRFFENKTVGTKLERLLPEIKDANDVISLLKRLGDATLRGDATAQIKRLGDIKIEGREVSRIQEELQKQGYKTPELFDFGSRELNMPKRYAEAAEQLARDYKMYDFENLSEGDKRRTAELLALNWENVIRNKVQNMLPNSPRIEVENIASRFVSGATWTGQPRTLADLIKSYKPDVGYGIEKWVGKYYGERLKEFTKDQAFKQSIDVVPESGRPMAETLAETTGQRTIDVSLKPKVTQKTKETKITKDIQISEDGVIQTKEPIKTLTKNTEWVKDIDITKENSYKKIGSRVNKEVGEIFGVKTEKGNLKASEVKTALEKINELASEIERIMPEGYIPLKGIKDLFGRTYKPSENIKGQGMGIRKSFPELYELGGIKGDVISAGTGRVKTGPGLDPYRKIADTKGKVIKEMLEIGKHDKITTPIARRLSPKVKAIINWIGKAMTNQAIRANKELLTIPEVKDKIQFHLENIVSDMAAGKPNTLASYDITRQWIKSTYGNRSKIKTISNLIRLVEQDNSLSNSDKKAILSEITFNPKGRIESKEFQEIRKQIKELEDLDVVKLSDKKSWIKEIDRLNKKYGWNIKKNKTSEIDGDVAVQRKLDFDKRILNSLPKFETLPSFVQERLLDQLGIGYIKYKTTASGEFKYITRKGKKAVDIVTEAYGKEVLKGNGKEYKGEFDAAHWQRKISQKELTNRGIELNIKSVKEGKSAEIKDVVADLLELYEANKITQNQYFNHVKKILKHKDYSYGQTMKANQKLAEAIFKPLYKEYKKAKDKGMEVSDIINHLAPLTNVATSVSKGFYTITSVPLKSGKPFVNKKGKTIRTHNEHEIQLFNFNKFLIDIITTSKTQTQFNARLKELIKKGEQAIITKELQIFNDSKEQGGQTGIGPKYSGKLSGNAKLIVFNQRGAGDNQLSLLGKKPMTVNEYILDKLSRNEIKKILKSLDKNEISVETVNLSKQVEYPSNKLSNLKLAKKQGVYVGSKDITNSELMRRLETRAQAIANARDINAPKKGASFLDFDDTIATSKSKIVVTTRDGKVKKITPSEFAKQSERLEKAGAKFDFSEFNKVIGGKKGPLFEKLVKINEKYGMENTFILTARPAESAPAIKRFLKGLGVDIKLKNIIGLEDGRPGAKANIIVEKAAQGYNDFYFVDDATQNVKAVKKVVDLLGVNGKIRKAIEMSSKDLSKDFNKILEETTGVEKFKVFSSGAAKARGANKGKWSWWLPPSAQGFLDLMYPTFGKGKKGNKHMQWFDEKLGKPYAKGFYELNKAKQRVHDDYQELKKQYPEIRKNINKDSGYRGFTNDAAIRVYLWNKAGMKIPDLSKTDVTGLVKLVKSNPELQSFAEKISQITKLEKGYVEPGESWLAKSIQHDLMDVSNSIGRKQFFKEWIDNKNQIFTPENLNKLEALYGSRHREALEDMLYRMETGQNKLRNTSTAENNFTKWIGNATGTIMFLNRRSALTQTISMLNFMNWRENNPIAIGKAFANQPQFWKDFSMIWNSPMLKQRRKGLSMDVNYEEIVNTVAGKKDKVSAAVAYMLNKGFVLTKLADNFAIAFGGSSFYRNRLNRYLKQGLNEKQAKEKAFVDFQEASEPTQQSARPDLISQQQASPLGRFVLAFQNVSLQNNRNMKRAVLDLKNKRGDMKTNISKIAYYGAIQNIIFLGMQQALFAAYWDDDATEDDITKKHLKIGNGMLDIFLRGSGYIGVGLSTIKNTILKYAEEREKGWKADETKVLIEALNISPPVGSKVRKLYSAMLEAKFNDGSIIKPSLLAAEAATNVPFNEFYQMVEDVESLTSEQLEAWQKIAVLLGYPEWQVDIAMKDIKTKKKKKKSKKPLVFRKVN